MKKIHIVITALLSVPLMAMAFYGYTLYSTQAQMPPVNICQNGLEKFTVRRECLTSNFNGYKRAIYRCFDGSHGEFTAKSCISYAELKSISNMNCVRLSKCIPTQTPTPTPTSVPTCSGPNGTPCSLIKCPSPFPTFYLNPTAKLMTLPCGQLNGICQNGRCIPGVTPTPWLCNSLRSKIFREQCSGEIYPVYYKYVDYVCQDGYQGTLGSPSSCKDTVTWEKDAIYECQKRPICLKTPTPTPAYNYPPSIITNFLPPAFYMTKYSAVVTAVDKNYNDALTVKFSYLPAGLTQGPCAIPVTGGVVSCHISGTPRLSGAFKVLAQVSDGFNPTVSKTFKLVVNPPPQPVTEYPTPPIVEVTVIPPETTPASN